MRAAVLAVLLGVFCAVPVFAEDSQVTFYNKNLPDTNLSVTKRVVSASEGYEPDDAAVFTFVLTLDGKRAGNVRYRVFNRSGAEIFQSQIGVRTPWKTSRNGEFTLKNGETARFENLENGSVYRVAEIDVPDDYRQVSPAGDAAGTLPPNGAHVTFTNSWNPPDTYKDSTDFVVRKQIVYPEGLEFPDDSSFTFQVELDGEPYAEQGYTIVDSGTKKALGEGETDEEGKFTLKAGQEAKFEDVPTDADYRVRETDIPDGYSLLSAEGSRGSTTYPETDVNFVNRYASFAVRKSVTGEEDPDHDFTFELAGTNHQPLADVLYYLYDKDGNLVRENGAVKTGRTGSDGRFTIRGGQTAVFIGLAPGTTVHLKELSDPAYVQITPAGASGYTDQEIAGRSIVTYQFVNEKKPEETRLTVTKRVDTAAGVAIPSDQNPFRFRLEKKNGDSYEPVGKAMYAIRSGTEEKTYETAADGTFTLKNNETAVFEELAAGAEYRVTETGAPEGYLLEEEKSTLAGTLPEGKSLDLLAVNEFRGVDIRLSIVKKNSLGSALSGAEFTLYTSSTLAASSAVGTAESDADGAVVFKGISTGEYWLKETKAPDGYRLPKQPVHVTITADLKGLHVSTDVPDGAPKLLAEPETTHENGVWNVGLEIGNSRLYTLPFTGGRPWILLLAAGIVIGAAAAHRILKEGSR